MSWWDAITGVTATLDRAWARSPLACVALALALVGAAILGYVLGGQIEDAADDER